MIIWRIISIEVITLYENNISWLETYLHHIYYILPDDETH